MKSALGLLLKLLIIGTSALILTFVFSPASFVDIYRGSDETSIWAKIKFLPFKKEISETDSYKFEDLKWSPDEKYLAFYDFTREEYNKKEWSLKIINPLTLAVKTIFIGDYKTGEYKWINNSIVRVYEGAGSGVRIYRDIDIGIDQPFIASDYMSPEYWTPEMTFIRPTHFN